MGGLPDVEHRHENEAVEDAPRCDEALLPVPVGEPSKWYLEEALRKLIWLTVAPTETAMRSMNLLVMLSVKLWEAPAAISLFETSRGSSESPVMGYGAHSLVYESMVVGATSFSLKN